MGELEALRYFEGSWLCEARLVEVAGPAALVRLATQRELDPGWLTLRHLELPPGGGRLTTTQWGFDRSSGQLLSIGIDNRGAHFCARSVGWRGEELAWAGEMTQADGQRSLFKRTYVRLSAREFIERTEVNTANQWRPFGPPMMCRAAPAGGATRRRLREAGG